MIGAPESVVGIAATSAPRYRRHRLRRVDHPPAAEGDQTVGADVVDDRGGRLVDLLGRDQVDALGGLAELGGVGEGPLGGEQLEPSQPWRPSAPTGSVIGPP